MEGFAARGAAAASNQNFDEAVPLFEQALRQDPNDFGSKAWLGQCLCSIGRRAEGVGWLRQAGRGFVAAARASGDTALLQEITVELQHWSDFEGALELGEETTLIDPGDARGYQLLALSRAQLNQIPDALEAGRKALALAPQNTAMLVLQASLEADGRQHAAARAHLEELLAEELEPRDAFRVHKEMARVLDKLGETGSVFPQLHAAAKLSGSLPEFAEQNAAALPAIVRDNRARFDRTLLGRWTGAPFPRDRAPPVFVVGFMRSGTTLTQEVLGAHPDVFVSDEIDFVVQTLRELHRMQPARLGAADKLRLLTFEQVLALRAYYWTKVDQHFGEAPKERVFVDKYTMNIVDLGFINSIFPDARVVFVQRDPRDVCMSCYMQLMVPSATTVQLLQWDGTARFYAVVMNWWLHIRRHLTMDVMELRYEDAVAAFDPTFARVFEFLGLAWDPAVADFHKKVPGRFIASPSRSQVAQPLYSSSVHRWRAFKDEFSSIREILRPFVQSFGYDPD